MPDANTVISVWSSAQRAAHLSEVQADTWDLVVIGGGITGAGVLREAARLNLRVLLIEANDLAYGSSSRTSKWVHGGLRYMAQGQFMLTAQAVYERQRMLKEAPGLVEPFPFTMPHYKGSSLKWQLRAGLVVYDLIGRTWNHRHDSAASTRKKVPGLQKKGLLGSSTYVDSWTDDARLVLRVLKEATQDGANVLLQTEVKSLNKHENGQWELSCCDVLTGDHIQLRAMNVINATGAWSDRLRAEVGGQQNMRPLRGSHFLIPSERLNVPHAIAARHPHDGRWVYVYPWMGRTVIGTTDVDHQIDLLHEPSMTDAEQKYLFDFVGHLFPSVHLSTTDIISSFSGVRPTIMKRAGDPSSSSREHAIWCEGGLVSVAGGKLTTFRDMARNALRRLSKIDPRFKPKRGRPPVFRTPDPPKHLDASLSRRLAGRFGSELTAFLDEERHRLFEIEGGCVTEGELFWAFKNEAVHHIEDAMLRRTRLGLLLVDRGKGWLSSNKNELLTILGWSDERWETSMQSYLMKVETTYGKALKNPNSSH